MASATDLLSQINEHYDVVMIEPRGTTAGGKIQEYDLWYRDSNGVVRFKRLHIFTDNNGNAHWYSENPIPRSSKEKSWAEILQEKAEEELSKQEGVVFWNIINIDEDHKRAILEVWTDDGSSLKTKKVFFKQNDDDTWDVRIRD